ncbi:hypothetical protein JCM6882_002908 [Rhodosporidiobolus microsporus]
MPVPTLPNELIALIFEHLWSILSTDPSTGHLITPRNAPFIFAPFLRVSKTWQQLAAPFWLAHVEANDRSEAKNALFARRLEGRGVVRSLHFDPAIPSIPGDPDGYDSFSDDDWPNQWSYSGHFTGKPRLTLGEKFEEELDEEAELWADLVGSTQHRSDASSSSASPLRLEQLEVGPRPKLSRRRKTKGRRYRDPVGDAAKPVPEGEILLALWPETNASRLRSLLINLPPGSSISDIANFTAKFPHLTQLHLTFLGPLAPSKVASELKSPINAPSTFPALEVLKISALSTSAEHLRTVVVPLLVKPTSASLKHLAIDLKHLNRTSTITSLELFEGCAFTNLHDLRLNASVACSIRYGPSFLADAPVIKTATVRLAPAGKFTVPPPSLEHLFLETATVAGLAGLKATLHTYWSGGALPAAYPSSLRTISVEFANTAADLQVEHLDVLRAIVALGAQHGVAVLGSWWTFLSDDARDIEAYETQAEADGEVEPEEEQGEEGDELESESEGSGEDDEMDWDTEEDPRFRQLWSEGKRRTVDLDRAFLTLREHFSTPEGFEAAKAAAADALESRWGA